MSMGTRIRCGRTKTGSKHRRLVLPVATAAAALALVGTGAVAQAATVQPGASLVGQVHPLTGGWGYVSDGNLRTDPNLNAGIEDTIYNQWVNILCWIDAGDNGFGSNRWFKAQYYSLQGYLSTGVVSSPPTVGHC
jgi:hypothetical protein